MYQVEYVNEETGKTCYERVKAEREQQARHIFFTRMVGKVSFTIVQIMYIY